MPPTVLDPDAWPERRDAHQARVDELLRAHRERRRAGRAHPVEDFLFTYYSHRDSQLRRWHPGAGVVLLGADAESCGPEYIAHAGGATVDVAAIMSRRRDSVGWIRDLLHRTAGRSAFLGCFGMHEWAMVYREDPGQIRHRGWPLRLGADASAAVVDQLSLRCSHFDAFRFFTAPARPLNAIQPRRKTQADNEQPGCLHANMDLYKWAYKLSPLVPSELVVDCFCLAREIRAIDMRASPYDLAELGYLPIAVETPEGRAEYVRQQRDFAARAAVLRERLIQQCDAVLG